MELTENINYWEKVLENPPLSFQKLFEQEKEYLRKNIQKSDKVLDVGCGDGRNILSIVDITRDIIGLDIDPKAIEDTRNNLKEYPEIKYILGSATKLPFEDGTFDVVVFSMTLVNLDNEKERALTEMKRVLKDGGKLLLSVYSEKALDERMKMYKQAGAPILNETNGKVVFGIPGLISEQFSIDDVREMVEPIGLMIDSYEEVENLAYLFSLKK